MRKVIFDLPGARVDLTALLWWTVWLVILFSEIISGALRYVLHKAGVVWLAYLPKFLLVGMTLMALVALSQNRVVFATTAGMALFAVIGLLQGLSPVQIAFGATIFFPMVFGELFWPYVNANPRRFALICALVLVVACVGLLWNVLGNIPWSGFTYNLGGQVIEGAREWGTIGLIRPSGFARLSAVAAIHVMTLTLILLPLLAEKSRLLAVLLGFLGLVFVVLTTTRAAIAAMLLILLLAWFNPFRLHRLVLGAFLVLSIFIPFTSTVMNYGVDCSDPLAFALLASFDERLTVAWPEGLRLISQHSVPLLGRGLSGVGTGEKYFGIIEGGFAGFEVMDNYALYLYGNFGVVGLIFLVAQFLAAMRLIESDSSLKQGFGLALGALLLFGFTTDSAENLLSGVVIGIGLRAGFSKKSL